MTKITIDSTSEEFKPQFAAYFNMALYNFWNVIEHVACTSKVEKAIRFSVKNGSLTEMTNPFTEKKFDGNDSVKEFNLHNLCNKLIIKESFITQKEIKTKSEKDRKLKSELDKIRKTIENTPTNNAFCTEIKKRRLAPQIYDLNLIRKNLIKYIPFYEKLTENVVFKHLHSLEVFSSCLKFNRHHYTHGRAFFT